jgi:hypothetical protein
MVQGFGSCRDIKLSSVAKCPACGAEHSIIILDAGFRHHDPGPSREYEDTS